MGLFKRIELNKKSIIRSAFEAVLFAFIMVFIVFNEVKQDRMPALFLNWLLYVGLSNGVMYVMEVINISWIEKPLKRFLVSLLFSAIYIFLFAILAAFLVLLIFHDQNYATALQFIDWRYIRIVFLISYSIAVVYMGKIFLLNWKESEIQAAKLRESQAALKFESLKIK